MTLQTRIAVISPRVIIRDMIEEVVWWHAQFDEAWDLRRAVTYDQVMSPSRDRRVVLVRNDCIRRIRRARPDFSTPRLGVIFGRDHTTILHSLGLRRRQRTTLREAA